jgi:hypothetical protein
VLLLHSCVVAYGVRCSITGERLFCYYPLVDMYGTCASEILNGRRPPKTRLCFACDCDHTFILDCSFDSFYRLRTFCTCYHYLTINQRKVLVNSTFFIKLRVIEREYLKLSNINSC